MKRISAVLKESDAMAVRKAVCVAGGERVVIYPMPHRLCVIDPEERDCVQQAARAEAHVRLEVTANDNCHDGIVSAIRRIAHAGKIVLASRLDRPHRCAA